jgi:hypothetical protein
LRIYDLYTQGKEKEASTAQLKLAQMEWGFAKGGINGTKWVVAKMLGYPDESSHCRRPYPQYTDAKSRAWMYETCDILTDDEKKL